MLLASLCAFPVPLLKGMDAVNKPFPPLLTSTSFLHQQQLVLQPYIPSFLTSAQLQNLLSQPTITLEAQFRHFYNLIHESHLDFPVLFSVTFVDDLVQPPDGLPQPRVKVILNTVVRPKSFKVYLPGRP